MNSKNYILAFLILILILSNISALCTEGQININNASVIELDNLYGIGSVKADSIINSRPFSFVDDLINVNGIGKITLEKIQNQGLACVDTEIEKQNKTKTEQAKVQNETKITLKIQKEITNKNNDSKEIKSKTNLLETINLNTKDIKSKNNIKISGKDKYAVYGLIGFVILLIFLFALKFRKKNYKNEFG